MCVLAACFLFGILAAAYGAALFGLPVIAVPLAYTLMWRREIFRRRMVPEGEKKCRRGRLAMLLWLGALAFFAGSGRFECSEQYRAAYLPALENGMRLSVQGTLIGKQIRNDQYIYELASCVIGADQSNHISKEPVSCNRILVYSDTDLYSIGQILVLDGTVELWKSAVNEGSFDAKTFYESQKCDFALKDVSVCAVYGKSGGIREKLWQLRVRLKEVYRETMNEEEAGIMATMAAGDKELLDAEIKRLYQVGGLSHILAISGLHISIIGMTLYRLLRKLGTGFGMAGILAGSVMYGYGVMAGGSVSVRRSVLMFLLFLGAQVLGRSYDSLSALGAAALYLLWDNPYLLWNTGFLFSFAAVIGVVWVGGCASFERETRAGRWAEKLFAAAAIQLATLPLVAWNYYEIPSYALFINLLVLPLVGVLLKLGVLGGLLGIGCTAAARIVLFPCQLLLSAIDRICTLAAGLPGAMWITGRPDVWQMALYYGVLIAFTVWAYIRKRGEKQEGLRVKAGRMAAVCVLLVGILCIPVKGGFELDVLDVGQGDGCFLRTAEGYTVFVDGGSSNVSKVGEYRILPFLKYKGARRIDCWIVSHTDEDHISGLKEVLASGYSVECLVFADGIVRDEAWEELVRLAAEAQTEVVYMDGGDVLHLGEAKLTALYPTVGAVSDAEKVGETDKNEMSLVIWYEDPEFTGIFTGDIGSGQEEEIAALLRQEENAAEGTGVADGAEENSHTVDFYKAAHHGSRYSNSEEFLQLLAPRISVVSCSSTNRYGHPSKEAVTHMEETGSAVFYTMEAGEITITVKDGELLIRKYGEPQQVYVCSRTG